jgi:maleate isomerase
MISDGEWTTLLLEPRKRREMIVGLLALDIDDEIEDDLRSHLVGLDIKISTNRLSLRGGSDDDPYRGIEDIIETAMYGLLPGSAMDAVVFGCTSAAARLGSDKVAERIRIARPSVLVVDPASASLNALSSIGAQSIGLITPYSLEMSNSVAGLFENAGFQIGARARFDIPDSKTMPTQDDYRTAVQSITSRAKVDCIFISCTGLPTAEVCSLLSSEFELPVLSSNQVVALELRGMLASP